MTPKISVLTPSTRPEALAVVRDSLHRQTFAEWEWLVCSPLRFAARNGDVGERNVWCFLDPPRRPGDFYRWNGAMNLLARRSLGELLVPVMDWIWLEPDALAKLWARYQSAPSRCWCVYTRHCKGFDAQGDPDEIFWTNPVLEAGPPLRRLDPREGDMAVAGIPADLWRKVGGLDEEYDRYAAVSEKDFFCRAEEAGSEIWCEGNVLAVEKRHGRECGQEVWDEKFQEARAKFKARWGGIIG